MLTVSVRCLLVVSSGIVSVFSVKKSSWLETEQRQVVGNETNEMKVVKKHLEFRGTAEIVVRGYRAGHVMIIELGVRSPPPPFQILTNNMLNHKLLPTVTVKGCLLSIFDQHLTTLIHKTFLKLVRPI